MNTNHIPTSLLQMICHQIQKYKTPYTALSDVNGEENEDVVIRRKPFNLLSKKL